MGARELGNPLGNPLGLRKKADGISVLSIKTVLRGNADVSAVSPTVIKFPKPIDASKSVVLVNASALGSQSKDTIAGFAGLSNEALTLGMVGGIGITDWTVLEFKKVKAVRRGSVVMSGDDNAPVPVDGIDMAKSEVFLCLGSGTTLLFSAISSTTMVFFDYSTNTIRRRFSSTGSNLQVYYQIVERI